MSSDQLPSLQRAVRAGNDGQLRLVGNASLPPLPPGYALVKTHAVALNPSDYKLLTNFPIPGAYVGSDFSGTIVRIAGDGAPADVSLQPGTMVAGAALQFSPSHRSVSGAFSEYVRVPASMLLRVPHPSSTSQTVSALEACTLPIAIATCTIALWSPDSLALQGTPDDPQTGGRPEPVLVYGGSTATGTIAVQLLRLSGYDPIATCSPRNFDLVRSRGASAVFDYSSLDMVARIREHTNGRLRYVLDCVSTSESATTCYESIQRIGGRYVSLERIPKDVLNKRKAVREYFVMAAEVHGEEVRLGHADYDRPASLEKHQLATRVLRMIQRLVDSGMLQHHPMEIIEGGLEKISDALDMLATGKVSGKKMVAMIDG